jgi:hypothetical protein
VPQTAPSKWGGKTVHWADPYCDPITFQIRDQLGLRSALCSVDTHTQDRGRRLH